MPHESTWRNKSPRERFEKMVNDHWDAVFRFAHSLTGNSHGAEDLAQETFTRALARLETFQAGTNAKAWLMRIACNAHFDESRRAKKLRFEAADSSLPSRAEGAESLAESSEERELLKRAVAELPDKTREIFVLRVQGEHSFHEIAEILEMSEEAARWHMHQARRALMERFKDHRATYP